jgi:hypothetical protein
MLSINSRAIIFAFSTPEVEPLTLSPMRSTKAIRWDWRKRSVHQQVRFLTIVYIDWIKYSNISSGDNCGASYLNDNFERLLFKRLGKETYLEGGGKTRAEHVRRSVPNFESIGKRFIDLEKHPSGSAYIPGVRADDSKRLSQDYIYLNLYVERSMIEGALLINQQGRLYFDLSATSWTCQKALGWTARRDYRPWKRCQGNVLFPLGF